MAPAVAFWPRETRRTADCSANGAAASLSPTAMLGACVRGAVLGEAEETAGGASRATAATARVKAPSSSWCPPRRALGLCPCVRPQTPGTRARRCRRPRDENMRNTCSPWPCPSTGRHRWARFDGTLAGPCPVRSAQQDPWLGDVARPSPATHGERGRRGRGRSKSQGLSTAPGGSRCPAPGRGKRRRRPRGRPRQAPTATTCRASAPPHGGRPLSLTPFSRSPLSSNNKAI
jgi:hypothetical protein